MTVQPLDEEAIFHAARAMSSPEVQADYLAQACGDNQALRARVEGLLKIYAEEKSFAGMPAEVLATIQHQPISERPGTVIGQYKLMEQIGEGGFGLVFVAEQHQPVRRKVALKVIKPGMDTRDVIARFEAERQALALMDHPNIAQVFDAGATDSGRPYFVMELVRGVPITEYCDEQHLTPRQRLELFVSLCHAIQHAHQKGIIHRDVKPTNVLVTEHDGRPVVKVIDFGVAKALSQQLTQRTIYTQFAQMIGTPLYMSPEQAAMSGLDIDTRSDIYSLGVLLYELLIGTTPFDRQRLQQAAVDEIRRIIREEEPPKPSTRLSQSGDRLPSIAALRSTEPAGLSKLVRGDLDWIVMKCLEKDRARRYETANGLAMDIQRHLDDEPVLACPPSSIYRLKKFMRRNKVATAFTLLLLIGVAALAVSNVQTRKNERLFRTESAKAKAVSDLLQRMLASSNPDEVKGADYTVRQLLDDFSAGLGDALPNQPEVEAEIRATIGRAYWRLGVAEQAESHLTRALELRRRLFGSDHEKVAESLVDYAWNLAEQSRHAEAETSIREALRIYRTRGSEAAPVIQAEWGLQRFLITLKRFDEAEGVAKQALTLARESGVEYPEVANILHSLAAAQTEQGYYAEAEQTARQAVEMHRRLHGPKHPETAWGLKTLGWALFRQGKLPEAEVELREALAIFRQHYVGDHKSLDMTLNDLKHVFVARGDQASLTRTLLAEEKFAAAEVAARECLDIREKKLPDDWLTFNERSMLGESLLGQNKYDEAEPLLLSGYEGMIQRADKIPSLGRPRLREALERLVRLYEATGQADEAALWKQRLTEFDQAETAKPTTTPTP